LKVVAVEVEDDGAIKPRATLLGAEIDKLGIKFVGLPTGLRGQRDMAAAPETAPFWPFKVAARRVGTDGTLCHSSIPLGTIQEPNHDFTTHSGVDV